MKGVNLTLDDLESAMTQHYRSVYGGKASEKSSDDSDEKEVTLMNFRGKCNKCHKTGHMAKDCKSGKASGGKNTFKGTCHNCGSTGHMATNCWVKEENKDKRPANWKWGIFSKPRGVTIRQTLISTR